MSKSFDILFHFFQNYKYLKDLNQSLYLKIFSIKIIKIFNYYYDIYEKIEKLISEKDVISKFLKL